MEFLQEVFVRYWREVIVAMLLTATLPFFRRHVRRLRARVIAFFTVRKRLESVLLEAEKWRKKSEEAEQKYLAEAEEKRKAVEEAERLRKELEEKRKAHEETKQKLQTQADSLREALTKPKQEHSPQESAKPEPDTLTAKLLELLRACEELPYPSEIGHYLSEVRDLIPPNGDVLRMKIMGAIRNYIFDSPEWNTPGPIHRKCTVLYVLIVIAQGISENLITMTDNTKKLTFKTAIALLNKINAAYFKEHPEVSKPSNYNIEQGINLIASSFGQFPTEVILEDKAFIQALLPSIKPVTVTLNKSKGSLGRLFG
ncbi:MAG: hypothetical protein IJS39_07595 [Synergistaceae bacterium]|nr:hypothetical protein [Synergistaceae bacterium]